MKKNLLLSAVVILIVSLGFGALAQTKAPPPPSEAEVDAAAMAEAQNTLRDSNLRMKALDTPEARKAYDQATITALGNNENANEIFNLAADLMPLILKEYPGQDLAVVMQDPKKVSELISKLPEKERARISALAAKIESEKSSKTKSP